MSRTSSGPHRVRKLLSNTPEQRAARPGVGNQESIPADQRSEFEAKPLKPHGGIPKTADRFSRRFRWRPGVRGETVSTGGQCALTPGFSSRRTYDEQATSAINFCAGRRAAGRRRRRFTTADVEPLAREPREGTLNLRSLRPDSESGSWWGRSVPRLRIIVLCLQLFPRRSSASLHEAHLFGTVRARARQVGSQFDRNLQYRCTTSLLTSFAGARGRSSAHLSCSAV